MKGVVVGDFLLPTQILAKVFHGDGIEAIVGDVATTDFVVKERAEIRTVWRLLEQHGPSGVPFPADLPALAADAEVLAVHICPVSRALMDQCPKLKIILSARGGLENIDVAEATKRGIAVIHTPHHNAQAVAEYAIGLMIAETRNIARSYHALKQGTWREAYLNSAYIPELSELKIGIAGYGQTGRLVARKLRAFDAEILVADPFVPAEAIERDGFKAVSLEELIATADIISLHVRLSPKTAGMIGHKEFTAMKPGAYLINTARSGLIDEAALIEALAEKKIGGAALDVFDKEPLPMDSPLLQYDGLTLTNHRAGDTRNSYWNAPNLMRAQFLRLHAGARPQFLANPVVLEKK
ncbi:MAG TPA: 2-hydroxyacid dehydrogenase [Rectinemataceae bacterium]|nr:2-hydroxyacid dehydrogenase [Rectinemataceae bacterium]